MSKTIDQKVVEMRFDNGQFEQRVKESMSTLDKLKAKLSFKDASKGFDNINASANKVNIGGLSSALDTCSSKFSALEVMGVTALANITNSAVNAGKRILNSLTIEPVTTGFNEYEMKMDSVKTILASTGESIETVNAYLEELNEYSDQTIYSFADMTQNIGKFTNAGVKLEDAVMAIKGISNEAAVSGANANEASRAMYNFAQALSAGYVKLIDWKSIENANMATVEFKQQLIDSAVAIGTLTEVSDGMYETLEGTVISATQNFNDSLQDQWMTTDVLVSTLKDYADSTTDIGKKAFSAAQDVTKFTQMLDVLKETAQSGWARTWEIIFGDIEQAKALFTPLTNFFSKIIDSISDFRNAVLESALGRSFTSILNTVNSVSKAVESVTKPLEEYQLLVDEIIGGKWGNAPTRWQDLTAAGYDWAYAQNLVNERLGSSVRHATNFADAGSSVAKSQGEVTEATKELLLELLKLSDAELKAMGYKPAQIKAFRELEKVADKTGIPIEKFIKNLEKINGRWLLFESFKNIGKMFTDVGKAIKQAWNDIFHPGLDSKGIIEKRGNALFNIIAALHKLTTKLPKLRDENGKLTKSGENLLRTFKGVFAVVDLVTSIIGGGFKIALAIVREVLSLFNLDILSFTAILGDGLVWIRDWVKNNLYLADIIKFIAKVIAKAVIAIKDWVTTNETIVKGVNKLKNGLREAATEMKNWYNGFKTWFSGMKDAESIPKYIFEGLTNGFKKGASTVFNFIIEFANGILTTIKGVLGIHSPSTEFYEIGQNMVQGLYNGVSETVKMVYTLLTSVGEKIIEIVRNLDLGSIFTIAVGTGTVYAIVKIAKALEALTSPMEVFADIGETFNKTLKRFNGVLSAVKFRLYAESIKAMAISVAIMAASIAVLTLVDQGKMWSAIGAIVVLAGVLAGLAVVAAKLGGKEEVKFGKLALTLLAVGVSLALMANAMRKIGKMKKEEFEQATMGILALMSGLILIMSTINKNEKGFMKLGSAFFNIGAAIMMMAFVIKLLGGMKLEQLLQGGAAVLAFSGIIVGLMAATKLLTGSKNVDKIANTIGKVGTAILMMGLVAKLLGSMDEYELIQGTQAIILFSGIIVGLMAATKLIDGSTNVGKIGGAIAGIAGAMLMMAITARILGMMKVEDLIKGTAFITAFAGIIVGLMAATKLINGSKNVGKIGRTLLMLSIAIGIMGLTATLLSLISIEGLAKGIIAVGLLSSFMAGLIYAVKFVKKGTMGTLITLTTAIGILALSIGILSAINPERLAGATIALGVVLGMFALVIAVSSLVPTAMGTMIVITVAIGLLSAALIALANLPIENTMAAATGLTMILLSLSAMMGVLALVGLGGPAALIGIGSLAALIVGIGGLVIGIGALMNKFPKLEEFLNKGIPILEKIGYALGSFFGNIIVGFTTAAVSGLPEIGLMLSQFMINATPFIAGMKLVNADMLAGVGILAAAIIALCAANLIEGMTSFMSFGSSFADLGKQLSDFMINAMPFIATAMLIPPGVCDSVRALAETILILTAADLLDGINIFGKTPLEKFASQLPILGTGIKNFITSLGPLSPDQFTTAKTAVDIIKTLAKAAKEIPNTGGLLGSLVGENDMATWAVQLPIMAFGIASFVKTINDAGIDASAVETANIASQIIKTLAEAAKAIPNTGGLLADLIGDNDLAKFAEGLPQVGAGIVGFIKAMSDGKITADKAEAANTAAKIIQTLAKASQEIPNTGGFLASLIGDNDLSTFAEGLPDIGKAIAGFASELGLFDDDKIKTVNSAVKAMKALTDLGNINIANTGSGLVEFGKNITKFAGKIKSFANTLNEVGSEKIDSAIKNAKKIVEMAKTAVAVDDKTFKSFGDSLKNLAKSGVKDFVKEFSGDTPKKDAKDGAKKLLQAVIDGLGDKSKKNDIKTKAKSLAEEAIKAMSNKSFKADAKDAGKDLCQGLINGLKDRDKRDAVYKAAYSLGQLAVKGEKDGQKSKSPSKATEQAGKWLGEGLIIGIKKMGGRVYGAGKSMGEEATNSISSALDTAMNLLNSDMDTQPTIRPVLDLSDVETGVGSISSMFNNGPSLGVAANLKAINSSMNARSQNGTNYDVVTAINRLGRSLGNVGGDTYNINGVTYDDQSGLSDAVRTIIRAANIERRI